MAISAAPLRWAAAFVWLYTGLAVVHPYYRNVGGEYLSRLSLPEWVMFATCAVEVALGLRVALGRAVAWVTWLQVVLILGFTTILAALEPALLVNPFGILNKNIPLLTVIVTAYLLEKEGWTPRAVWLLRGGLAAIWITEGLLPKILFLTESEIQLVRRSGLSPMEPEVFIQVLGAALALGGVLMLVLPARPLRWLLLVHIAALVFLPLAVGWQDPHLWVHPFGPLIKNVPILVGSAVLFRHLRPSCALETSKSTDSSLSPTFLFGAVCALAVIFAGAAKGPSAEVLRPADLAKEAATAHPAAAALLRELARPADQVQLRAGSTILIQPLPLFVGHPPTFPGTLQLTILEATGSREHHAASADLKSLTPYEEIALKRVREFLGTEAADLSLKAKLDTAVKVLQALLRFHEGGRRQPSAGLNPWADLHTRLGEQLLELRRRQLDLAATAAADSGQWTEVLQLADTLLATYPQDNGVKLRVRKAWSVHGKVRGDNQDWPGARRQLARIEAHFLHSPEADPLRELLHKRAETLIQEAQASPDAAALRKLQEALTAAPCFPGLRDAILQRQKAYPVLYVAVRSLPEFLSPATAWTDSEKQTVELIFESLVQASYDGTNGERYWPGLARTLPDTEPGRRHFTLTPDAFWSDGERVTPADVRHTVQLLRRAEGPGRSPRWDELVELPRLSGDSFSIDFTLRQGAVEPLALLSFKVLPQNFHGKPLTRVDDAEFAKAPVGSGPFRYLGRTQQNQRTYAVFAANPHHVRAGRQGLPLIREIRLFAWSKPDDLRKLPHPVHIVLDIATDQIAAVRALGIGEVRSLPGRRVSILALNHRTAALKDHNLRRALAHAIDRQALLERHFRGAPEGHADVHISANGPYPRRSWAASPRAPLELSDADLAKNYARQAFAGGSALQLTLKYPDDDPRIDAACRDLAGQMEKLAAAVNAELRIKLVPLPPRQVRQALDARDFDLLYHHLEYADETFNLLALFDPHAEAVRAGGANYLGYDSDAKLQSLFQSTLSTRRFPRLQEITHDLHAHLFERMPLIPLWELHRHIAVHPHLSADSLDPDAIFRHAAEWKLQK